MHDHPDSGHSTLREGLLIGLAGGIASALWFVASGLLSGDPLQIPNLLGQVLFGAGPVTDAVVRSDAIAGYAATHFGFFVALGLALTACVHLAERVPAFRMALLIGGAILLAALAYVTSSLPALVGYAVSFWMLFLGVILGVGTVAWLAWQRHAALRESFDTIPLGDAERRNPPAPPGGLNV